MPMATLQVKNLPADLHAAVAQRARDEHLTMSEFVTRTLRKELSRPSLDSWINSLQGRDVPARDIDSVAVIDEVRAEAEAGMPGRT